MHAIKTRQKIDLNEAAWTKGSEAEPQVSRYIVVNGYFMRPDDISPTPIFYNTLLLTLIS